MTQEIKTHKFHEDGDTCSGCEKKLEQVHPTLAQWFRAKKKKYPNMHVSDGWRGPADQKKAFDEHKSDLLFPKSKHNRVDEKGNPRSEAVDLFQIDEDGAARWSPMFYSLLNAENLIDHVPIRWGIKLKSGAIDNPHFELIV